MESIVHSPGRSRRPAASTVLTALGLVLALACGSEEPAGKPSPTPQATETPRHASTEAVPTPDDLDQALVLSLAHFLPKSETGGRTVPGAARLEFLVRRGGEWTMTYLEDADSNVFHKAMAIESGGRARLLTAGGSGAVMKLWSKGSGGELVSETLWSKDFGGKFSRMRDVEVADLFGDGSVAMAVATHDQGVVATLRREAGGGFTVTELDHETDTFVHEIEIGDLDGDGTLEVYATPSEPNRLDGSPQSGQVVRYVPRSGEGRVVVADLGDRHAKEIYVGDVDGNGRDELYVVVEGKSAAGSRSLEYGVEIRRYEADTKADAGVTIAELDDRLCRFLAAGDIDGDGKKELVVAAYSSGVWLLRPGADPMARWKVTSIDRKSGGFEHATVLTDLDGDGTDEIYVASDKNKELRRYAWNGSRLVRETIYRRGDDRSIFTWNIMPVPVDLVPASNQAAKKP